MSITDSVIATFNMESLDDSNADLWKERVEVLRPMLRRVDAQVLLLQEIHTMSALDDLWEGTGYERYHQHHTEASQGRPYKKRNLVTLSKYPIDEERSCQCRNDLAPAPSWKMVTSDHLIVSQALYPYWVDTSILNETLHDESLPFATEEKFPESDHAPVADRFRIPETRCWKSQIFWMEGFDA